MITLKKTTGRDFTVLNIGDPQVDYERWGIGLDPHNMIRLTLDALLPRVKPDLITVTGDLSDEYGLNLYEYIIGYIDELGYPWATVFGNHDQEDKADPIVIMQMLKEAKNCLFERGPEALGYGHYTVAIEEDGRICSALIFMDSHNRKYYTDENGKERRYIVPFTQAQLDWYRSEVEALQQLGCNDTGLIFHIPLHEFKLAWNEAVREDVSLTGLLPWDTEGADIWSEGYESSFGINYEEESCHSADVKFFDLIKELGSTKHILCGHDHNNNSSILYKGVRLTYASKTGCGGYYDPRQNGCTVIKIGRDGIKKVYHEYHDLREMWYSNKGKYND